MPKVVVTAQVQDAVKWEEGFRTQPINFGAIEGNHVAVCLEPDDLGAFMKVMDSPATAEAMAFDGVKRETVRVFVLDKALNV